MVDWGHDVQFVITENTTGRKVDTGNFTSQHLQADGNLNFQQTMDKLWDYMQILGNDLRFCPAYPDYILALRADLPESMRPTMAVPVNEFQKTVTYKIVRKEPGHVAGGPAFGPMKETKPRLRDPFVKSEGSDDESYEIYGQRFENLVQFDCWAKSNREAEELIEWFEDFLLVIAGPIKKAGLAELKYWARREDQSIAQWKTPLQVRTLVYYLVTEKLIRVKHGLIKTITVGLERIKGQSSTL